MRDLITMKATYLRKLTALYASTSLLPAVPQMADDYIAKMQDLRDKQLLAKDVMNAGGITSGRQAGFQMLTNKFWYLQTQQDYSGDVAKDEFGAAAAYFKAKYQWAVPEAAVADAIAVQVFNVTI